MGHTIHVLIVEDRVEDAELIWAELRRGGFDPQGAQVSSQEEFLAHLHGRLDLILSDNHIPGFGGMEALRLLKSSGYRIPFIMISGAIGDEAAVACIKQGAYDFIRKENLSRLGSTVRHALDDQRLREGKRRAEDALRVSEAFANRLVDSSLDMIIAVDENRHILRFNKAAERSFGYTAGEVLGRHVDLLYAHPEQSRAVLAAAQEAGQCVRQVVNRRKNGATFLSHLAASVILDSAGKVVGYMGVSRDITEQQQAQDKLQEQAHLLDLTQDAIFVRDLDDRVVFWNKGAETLYGWTAAEAAGRKITDLIDKETADFEAAKRAVLEHGQWSCELRHFTKEGQERIVSHRATLLRDGHGRPKSILVTNTDITEKKRLESQQLRAQRLESIGTLASGIAHDLNNILAPILMSVQILSLKPREERERKLLETIDASAQRGADVVRQVLTFARGIEGSRVPVQLSHLIKDLVKIMRETFPRNIEIKLALGRDLWPVIGDPTQLHQVLLNLCVNARDAMPNGGALALEAENASTDETAASQMPGAKPGSYVVVSVSDTGTGISREVMEKIFDPFFTTKSPSHGTGLGLATVQGIVRNHGGFIHVTSTPGKGTVFKVQFPAAPGAQLQPVNPTDTASLRGHGELILVVDDEEPIRETIRQMLSLQGYEILVAAEGTEAVATFAQNWERVRLVMTDLMMPHMSGLAAVRALKKMNPDIKVIAISGLFQGPGREERFSELAALGVKTFLSKPFNMQALFRAVYEELNPGQIQLPPNREGETPSQP